MKKSQIVAIALIVVISLINAAYHIYLGYTNGPDHIAFDTIVGTVEEYHVHNGAAFVTLGGQEIPYRASANGNYDKLGLEERPLLVGETVELLFETKIRGSYYPIIGISTETWDVSIEDAYLKGWARFQILTCLFGAFLGLAGVAVGIILVKQFRKANQKSNESKNVDSRFMAPTSIIRESSPKRPGLD